MEYITILGATGSIGCNTLSVIREHPDKFKVFALSGNQNVQKLYEQCIEFKPKYAVLPDPLLGEELKKKLSYSGLDINVLSDKKSLELIASAAEVTQVMAAIVGIAGLIPTYAAIKAGKRILLANKESLVTAGKIFTDAAKKYGAEIIPVDSEHNAIFQCLPEQNRCYNEQSVSEIILTASGGPFLKRPLSEMKSITPEEACAHPNWTMGQKISVDSSTMMNKALEVVEAYWLFNMPIKKLKVLIHPESIVHSMVKYHDGSFLAQIGSPDMRTPIAYSLFYPKRGKTQVIPLDLTKKPLTFHEVDAEKFPVIDLVFKILQEKNYVGAIVLNAANEVLVEAFLKGEISYEGIVIEVAKAVSCLEFPEPKEILDVMEIDKKVRTYMHERVLV